MGKRVEPKYKVWASKTGEWLPDSEAIFVLRPELDAAAVPAMKAYAEACEEQFPKLANEIRMRLAKLGLL